MSRRIRKHTNPFNVQNRIGLIDRMAVFGREAPLEVDIGCGAADFVFQRAKNNPDRDIIGLEVRKPLVLAAGERREKENQRNAMVYHANAHENLDLAPKGSIVQFHVQFPDPCFKKRHQKRRILQPKLMRGMAEVLPMGGKVFLQSDVKPLAEEMYYFMAQEPAFKSLWDPSLLVDSPFEERTEWERHHEAEGEPIYRMMFEKIAEPSGEIPVPEFKDVDPARLAALAAEEEQAE